MFVLYLQTWCLHEISFQTARLYESAAAIFFPQENIKVIMMKSEYQIFHLADLLCILNANLVNCCELSYNIQGVQISRMALNSYDKHNCFEYLASLKTKDFLVMGLGAL